jgi:hypothetical protein
MVIGILTALILFYITIVCKDVYKFCKATCCKKKGKKNGVSSQKLPTKTTVAGSDEENAAS